MNTALLKADLSRAKTRDVRPLLDGAARGVLPDLCRQVALVATECPPEWGAPDRAETYLQFPVFGKETRQIIQWYKSLMSEEVAPVEAEFDLSAVTVAEFEIIMQQMRTIKVDLCIGVLMRTVKTCSLVSNPKDAACYLELPFYTVFRPLVAALVNASVTQMQNFLSASADG